MTAEQRIHVSSAAAAEAAALNSQSSLVLVGFSPSICGELSWTEELIRRLPEQPARRAAAALNINETRPGSAGQLGPVCNSTRRAISITTASSSESFRGVRLGDDKMTIYTRS